IPEVEFRTWFEQVSPDGFDDGSFVIAVPHTFARDWLRNNYTDVIESALKEIGARTVRVAFRVVGTQNIEQHDLFSTQGVSEPSTSPAVPVPGNNGHDPRSGSGHGHSQHPVSTPPQP